MKKQTLLTPLLFAIVSLSGVVPHANAMCMPSPCYYAHMTVSSCTSSPLQEDAVVVVGTVEKWRDLDCRHDRGVRPVFEDGSQWYTSNDHPNETPDFSSAEFEMIVPPLTEGSEGGCTAFPENSQAVGILVADCLDTLPRKPQPRGVSPWLLKPLPQ